MSIVARTRSWIGVFHIGIVSAALTVAGLISLFYGIVFLLRESVASAVAGLGAGVVLLFAATIQRFESIKGLGMEAKTRELNKTIDKAEVAIEKLNELTQLVGSGLIRLYSGIGRLDAAPTVMENHKIAMQIKQMLVSIGVSDLALRECLEPWLRITALDSYFVSYTAISKRLQVLSQQDFGSVKQGGDDALRDAKLRKSQIDIYLEASTKEILRWNSLEVAKRLDSLVDEAPELGDADREELNINAKRGAVEIRKLIANLDFADRNYWERLGEIRS